jgi:hypothetical protein
MLKYLCIGEYTEQGIKVRQLKLGKVQDSQKLNIAIQIDHALEKRRHSLCL